MATEAKVVITAEDRASAVLRGVRNSVEGAVSAFRGLTAAAAAIGTGAALAGIRSIVDGLDRLNDARDATGATIENLSALEDVVIRNGNSFDTATGALLRFNTALGDAKPGSETAQIIERLGLSLAEIKADDPVIALQKVAVAFKSFADDGEKSRAFLTLFGRSTREVAPILNDLAEAGQLNAKVSTQQAKEAEEFNKQLSAAKKDAIDLARVLVSDLVPALTNIIRSLRESESAIAGFKAIGTGVRVVFETLAVLGANVIFVLQAVGREIGARVAQYEALRRLDFSEALSIGRLLAEDSARARADLDKFEKGILNSAKATETLTKETEKAKPSIGGLAATVKQATFDFKAYQDGIQRTALAEAQWQSQPLQDKLRELERLNDLLGRTQTDNLTESIRILDAAFFDGLIGVQEYEAAIARVTGTFKEVKDEAEKVSDSAEKFAFTLTSSLGKFIEDGGKISDFFRSLLKDITKLVVQITILQPLADSIRASLTGSGGSNFFGNLLSTLGGAIASAAGGVSPGAPSSSEVRQGASKTSPTLNITVNAGSNAQPQAVSRAARDGTFAAIREAQLRGAL